MTAGFQAWTDSGLVQIDGTTQNYALLQQFNVTTAAGAMNAGKSNANVQYTFTANIVDFTISAVAPLICLYSPNAYATILRCVSVGTNLWSVRLWSNTSAVIGVYIFDQSSAAAPSGLGYGLQVFDASGNLIADARQRLARVIDTQSGNINNTSPGWGQWNQVDSRTYQFSYPAVSKIGVAAIGTAFVSSPTGGNNNGWYNISGLQTAGNIVNFSYSYNQVGNTSHPGNNTCFGSQYDWRFMAIDLSNL
ncbi:hypothetical protein [Paraburkholderia domus]|uniref:hypothetical protein n=1 Tax=Paraburkholderia domus TaxID=2793075 RepID=UPI001911EE53|nr:hypothetical protein [Paraburkholderia domus]MBK5058888.1 hypothetical protein [Burkholderia sp. R-70199]CAE6879834.1 hypothetical protein R70199_02458 [Paraburkholderia domus]